MVVRPGSTKKEDLINVVSQLEFADAKVIGFILNGVEMEHSSKYSYRNKYVYASNIEGSKRSAGKTQK